MELPEKKRLVNGMTVLEELGVDLYVLGFLFSGYQNLSFGSNETGSGVLSTPYVGLKGLLLLPYLRKRPRLIAHLFPAPLFSG